MCVYSVNAHTNADTNTKNVHICIYIYTYTKFSGGQGSLHGGWIGLLEGHEDSYKDIVAVLNEEF